MTSEYKGWAIGQVESKKDQIYHKIMQQ